MRDLRIAEIEKLDLRIDYNKVVELRARVDLSFRYIGSCRSTVRCASPRDPKERKVTMPTYEYRCRRCGEVFR